MKLRLPWRQKPIVPLQEAPGCLAYRKRHDTTFCISAHCQRCQQGRAHAGART